MNLGQIQHIITNFIQREWTPKRLQAELNFAQLRYFDVSVRQGRDLYQFKVKKGEGTPPLYVVNGFAAIPSDYYHFLSMNVPSGGTYRRVRKCDDELFEYLRESPIEYPTEAYPICRFTESNIQFLPATTLYVNFTYYKIPPAPVYGFVVTNGFIEYNAATSVELDWDESDQVKIIQLVLQDLGVMVSVEQIEAQKK